MGPFEIISKAFSDFLLLPPIFHLWTVYTFTSLTRFLISRFFFFRGVFPPFVTLYARVPSLGSLERLDTITVEFFCGFTVVPLCDDPLLRLLGQSWDSFPRFLPLAARFFPLMRSSESSPAIRNEAPSPLFSFPFYPASFTFL